MKRRFLDAKGCLNGFQTCLSPMGKVHAFLIAQVEVVDSCLSSLRVGDYVGSVFP